MHTEKLPLSVAIITKNEEDRLSECLDGVSFAAEVVVVDSGSTDKTVEIARAFGAVVYEEPWQGFGRQKQLAIDRCSHDWVLVLDADERIEAEARQEIGEALATGSSVAYSFPRKNYFCGCWLKHAGWWPDRVVRLFRKDSARMSERAVHESLEVHGPVGALRHPLIHYANKSLEQTLSKVNLYSSAGAEELFSQGKTASAAKAFLRAGWSFFYNYILRGGFLDKGDGFIMAVSDFMNVFFKYAKLRELRKQKEKDTSS
ncbi:MAG: glycosyltransferase family 2 protein [Desulfobulbaceae bacterium]|nr:glycosyltransferase family 2 protein [Desulfobulbaceae bacterium]HIJ91454.1 glycosyltransferase family 2 protein [Deltaproteobacteria bacterium]